MSNTFATFEQFLRSACLGSLRCGLTQPEVEFLLSKPKITEDYPNGASLWSYGMLEIRFFAGRIESFGLYYAWNRDAMPECLNPTGYFPDAKTTVGVLKEFLEERNIPFEIGRDGQMFRTSAGVWVLTTAESKLMSIVAEDRTGRAVLEKQFRRSMMG